MRFSAVMPLPGVTLARAQEVLRDWTSELQTFENGNADERLSSYHSWASSAADHMASVFSLEDVETLVATRRHDLLMGRATAYNQFLVSNTISAEFAYLTRTYAEVLTAMQTLSRWAKDLGNTKLVLPDTNFYLHYEKTFDEVPWRELLETQGPVRVLVPLQVVRELDKAKRAPGNKWVDERVPEKEKVPVRTRARITGRILRQLMEDPNQPVELGPKTTLELLHDAPAHVRRDDADSEILKRGLAAQVAAGQKVTVVTSDNNMQFAALMDGLDVFVVEA